MDDIVEIDFKMLQDVCKWFTVSFDRDKNIELACHNKGNITYADGTSWGYCSIKNCPFLSRPLSNAEAASLMKSKQH